MLLFSIGYAHSQERVNLNVDSLAEAQAKELLSDNKVQHVIIYQTGCVGCKFIRAIDCGCEDDGNDTFLIWQKEQKQYVKQIGCCIAEDVVKLQDSTVFLKIINNKKEVFSSNFKYSYLTSHYRFDKLSLVSLDGKKEVYLKDYFFDKENIHRQHNLKQPAKAYTDKLSQALRSK